MLWEGSKEWSEELKKGTKVGACRHHDPIVGMQERHPQPGGRETQAIPIKMAAAGCNTLSSGLEGPLRRSASSHLFFPTRFAIWGYLLGDFRETSMLFLRVLSLDFT